MPKRPQSGGPPKRKFLVLVAGTSATVLEADSAEAAQEEFLFGAGYLDRNLKGETRRALVELARKHKPYLFDRVTVREATAAEVEQYAGGGVDLVSAPKSSGKAMPSGTKQATRLGVG